MNTQARTMSIVFGVIGMFAGITALDALSDGASMSLRFLTVTEVIAPWVIAGAIVLAANEIAQTVKAIRQ